MNEIILNIDDIKKLIPHREPMLLLDQVRILSLTEACGTYFVKGDEYFLQGHYPDNPMVPGNIQSEMSAQLGAVLVCYNSSIPDNPFHNLRKNKTPVLAGLNNVRFKNLAKPGDIIELHINIIKDAGLIVIAEATVTVRGCITASEEMTVAFI